MENALERSLSPHQKRNGSKQESHVAPSDGRKQWLTRKDIENEYGWSYKTTIRLEQGGKLVASVVHVPRIDKKGKRKTSIVAKPRIKRYFRPHIEALLQGSFVSLRAFATQQEGTI